MAPPPVLTTDRLTLRPFRRDDTAAVLAMHADPRVRSHPGGQVFDDPAEAERRVAQRIALDLPTPQGVWAITATDDPRSTLLGNLLLKPLPPSGSAAARDPRNPDLVPHASDTIEIGWRLHPDVWGRGWASEAARAVISHAAAHGLTTLHAVTHPDNTDSQRICARLGMVSLGLTDEWYDSTSAHFRLG